MTPQTMLVHHDPAAETWGDCARCALAAILDLPADDVPHFYHRADPDGFDRLIEWVRGRGLLPITIGLACEPAAALDAIGANNPDVEYLMFGTSPRGFGHVVACRGAVVASDPSPEGGDLVGPAEDGVTWVVIIARPLALDRDDG